MRLDERLECGRTSRIWTNILSMDEHLESGRSFRVWTKISNMDENLEYGRTYRVWTNFSSMDEHLEYGRTSRVWTNISYGRTSRVWRTSRMERGAHGGANRRTSSPRGKFLPIRPSRQVYDRAQTQLLKFRFQIH